jgi:acetolactate synthase-1/3 small subunit
LALIKIGVTATNRSEVMQLVEVFRSRIVDVANDSLIVEITGDEDKINSFVEVLRPFGILEMVRTGLVAMARGVSPALPAHNGYDSGAHVPAVLMVR